MSRDRKLESCEQGYPCVYMRIADTPVCTLGKCCVKHVMVGEKEFAYDEVTGRLTEWTTVQTPEKQTKHEQKKRNDDWYEKWLEKNGFGGYKEMMEHNGVGTHERHKGAKRQRRAK